MSIKDMIVTVLTAGATFEYVCEECDNEFESSRPECPGCGSENVVEPERISA